jgi:hypothetical protein
MRARTGTLMKVEEAGRTLQSVLDLDGRVQRNPYAMLAGALGMGFVLGGGLFTQLTAKVVGAGLRMGLMAALPMLEKELLGGIAKPKKGNRR